MATTFIDKARVSVKAGTGGNGCVSFHREKYIAAGGPDGGDGGKGGDIVLQVDDNLSTLMDFRYKRKYVAENGVDGMGQRKSGRDGKSLVIKVPRGTLVRDLETNEIIKDMSGDEPYILCKGGKGGWGNTHFATPTRQAPRFAKSGLPGEAFEVTLELKLLADVGLIGFPNVGKSTLLSVVSRANPKIANYHFTTLFPNLGVAYVEDGVSFVMADIPGIIEGASEGAGLATTSCGISTGAGFWSMWWTCPAARGGTLWRTSTPSIWSSGSTARSWPGGLRLSPPTRRTSWPMTACSPP